MDPYLDPDALDDEVLDSLAGRLESRGRNATFTGYIDQYLDRLELGCRARALDLGCGTGLVLRQIAARAEFRGELHGVDISQGFIRRAEALAKDCDREIRLRVADATSLPYPADSFDVVVLHTLMSHTDRPVAILEEARRVLAPDGRLVIFDADFASITYAIEDGARGREIDLRLISGLVSNPYACRLMPRYLRAAELELEDHAGHLLHEAGQGDFWVSSVESFAQIIGKLELLPPAEERAWVDSMRKSQEDGTFFAACNYYTFFAGK